MADSIYLFYGSDEFLVKNQIDVLIETLNVDPINIVRYDLIETNQQDVLEEIQTVSFFQKIKL